MKNNKLTDHLDGYLKSEKSYIDAHNEFYKNMYIAYINHKAKDNIKNVKKENK